MSDKQFGNFNQVTECATIERWLLGRNFAANHAWYLVQCKPNAEHVALRNFENQNFPAFLPLQSLTRRKGTTFETQIRPLFPGYMFVLQNPAAGEWKKINNTRGVARLVRLSSHPTPVPKIVINQLFARCDASGVFQQTEPLVVGDNVKITQGSFSGVIGKILDIDPNQRVHLLLDFMGQTSKLTLDFESVTPTS